MNSLKRSLKRFFLALALVGTLLLVWGLYLEWQSVRKEHEFRQRAQITTIANALHATLTSQETMLTLMGGQVMTHWRMGHTDAVNEVFAQMLEINQTAAGYGLLDADVSPVALLWREAIAAPESRSESQALGADCEQSVARRQMVVGTPYRIEGSGQWLIPLCTVLHDEGREVDGFMVSALALEGPDSFFSGQAVLGRSNIVQVVRERDLSSLLWATALDLPEDYLAQPISRELYEDAISSAERISGVGFEAMRESGKPYAYRLESALGVQFGMALHDSRYRFWVLTQTSRGELLGELLRIGWVYLAVYFVVLASVLFVLVAIGRAERRRREDLIHQANHDMLTGLPNRQRMAAEFESMQCTHGKDFSLLFIDMDNFKAVNDGFGHVQGDAVLQLVGQRLKKFAGEDEKCARVGGDEFVVMTPETDVQRLMSRARALINCLTERYNVNGLSFELGCSVGIARVAEAGTSLNDVLRAADVAMYSAKPHRNAARLYEAPMGQIYLENIKIEQRLRIAIDNRAIEIVYQPQVDSGGRIVGVEALARWNDPELGPVGPARFVAIAEASGLIGPIGDHILERCLEDASALRGHAGSLRMSINISVRQFLQPEFASRLIERVGSANLENIVPVIEITESLFVEDYGAIAEDLDAIRQAGIEIALDDFGTGFSSLALLRNLPIDELKIDKSFVDHLESEDSTRKLIQSIVAIGRNHGLSIVAEGVETQCQFEMLKEDGCDGFQGYLFARPLGFEELVEAVQSARPY